MDEDWLAAIANNIVEMEKEMKMLLNLIVITFLAFAVTGAFAGPHLPPADVKAEWNHPAVEGFKDWKIMSYEGWGEALDGGSKVFSFKGGDELKFEVAAVSPQYWTDDEKKARAQVFYMIHNGLFYRIEAGSEQEQALMVMLKAAGETLEGEGDKDPEHLEKLVEALKSRKSWF